MKKQEHLFKTEPLDTIWALLDTIETLLDTIRHYSTLLDTIQTLLGPKTV